ncbi:hypothetical protein TEGAF0_24220 [Sediminibacterium sp. TEGAF015]|nr:hypothetical protein TEGAF0_24220 [Sediminibacterium sp. TEGAF015]
MQINLPKIIFQFIVYIILIFLLSCSYNTATNNENIVKDSTVSCLKTPDRYRVKYNSSISNVLDSSLSNMVLIPGGSFEMGGDGIQSELDELPKHLVTIDSFYMDQTEVTNAQFAIFVNATGYITTAERKPIWSELKKILPTGTTKPADSLLVAASLVFKQTTGPVDFNNYSQWWSWVKGANWKSPEGPGSNIKGKENYPVVHISWDDAMAYCKWAGKRLPTEAEWEFAARGGKTNQLYPWGNQPINQGFAKANSWEGKFPYFNEQKDGFIRNAPVATFNCNGFGLFDMAGNVWEWCSDWYSSNYYQTIAFKNSINPKGPAKSFDPENPSTPKKVLRGGSFLCNDEYCSGYRVARRMKSSPDTGLEHTGFRCVKDISKRL